MGYHPETNRWLMANTTFIDEICANESGNSSPAKKKINKPCESVKKKKSNGPHGFFAMTDARWRPYFINGGCHK